MSARCLNMVLNIDLPPTQKSILRALAWRANGTFAVTTSIPGIRADTGLGDSTIRRELAMLSSRGYLTVVDATRGPTAHSTYQLIPPRASGLYRPERADKPPPENGMPTANPPAEGALTRAHAGSTPPLTTPPLPEFQEGGSGGNTDSTAQETLRLLSEIQMPKPKKGIQDDDLALRDYWRKRYGEAMGLNPHEADSRVHTQALGFVARGEHAKKYVDLRRAFQHWIGNDIDWTKERHDERSQADSRRSPRRSEALHVAKSGTVTAFDNLYPDQPGHPRHEEWLQSQGKL